MDDFFADLLPQKQSDDAAKAGSTSNAGFQDDAVLPSKLESPKSTVSQSSLDLMSGDSQKAHSSSTQQPMGESKMKRELKEHQQVTKAVVENALKRFSGDLQRVLEEISRWAFAWSLPGAVHPQLKQNWKTRRRLESVEHQTEQLGRAVADSREVDGQREDAFKDRLTAIDKSIRDVSRNVQLVRDKQVSACCM